MSQNLFFILLPTILIIGTFMIYRSYRSVSSISINSREHGNSFVSLQNHSTESNHRVQVEFFVMSKCPDAVKCETLFLPSLFKLSSIINFTLSFIATESKTKQFICKHGESECIGNRQQLCVQNMYSQTIFMKYLLCQTKQLMMIPDNGEQCAKETSSNLIHWSDVQSCVTSTRSNTLFHQSLEGTRLASAQKSCTMHLNGQFWCKHDGFWSNCAEGHDEKSFVKSICSRYKGKNPPSECTTLV